jgi:hypothetical protein
MDFTSGGTVSVVWQVQQDLPRLLIDSFGDCPGLAGHDDSGRFGLGRCLAIYRLPRVAARQCGGDRRSS